MQNAYRCRIVYRAYSANNSWRTNKISRSFWSIRIVYRMSVCVLSRSTNARTQARTNIEQRLRRDKFRFKADSVEQPHKSCDARVHRIPKKKFVHVFAIRFGALSHTDSRHTKQTQNRPMAKNGKYGMNGSVFILHMPSLLFNIIYHEMNMNFYLSSLSHRY